VIAKHCQKYKKKSEPLILGKMKRKALEEKCIASSAPVPLGEDMNKNAFMQNPDHQHAVTMPQ
jgi:hypothetical protein